MSPLSIAVTGTRAVPDAAPNTVQASLADHLRPFCAQETTWLLGGAAGIDTLALAWLADRSDRGRIVVAVPVTVAAQPAAAAAAINAAEQAGRLDDLVELNHPEGLGAAAYTARNRWLVDRADVVVGFPLTPTHDSSGTWETLRYARASRRPIVVAALSDGSGENGSDPRKRTTREDTTVRDAMTQRLDIHSVDPKAHQAVFALERYVRESGLDPRLYELVKIRASQLNGCAFCLDMHLHDARAAGEDQRRLDVLAAWREAPELFTDQERATLELTEAVTRIGDAGVPAATWDDIAEHFDQAGVVHLLMAIATINVWNRLAVSTHQRLPQRVEADPI